MKKIDIICCSLIITMLLFSGCSKKDVIEKDYTFKGGNELWKAEYVVDGSITFTTEEDGNTHVESESKEVLTVTYQGELEDLAAVKHSEITYKRGTSGGSSTADYGEEGGISSKVFTIMSGGSGVNISEDEVITLIIKMDEDVQTLELTTK